jgi:hypothetical protein
MNAGGWICGILFAAQAVAAAPTIKVQVHNAANVPQSSVRRALAEAVWILRQAGIEMQWIECGNSVRESAELPGCRPRTEPGLFVLSLLGEDSRAGTGSDALGFAVLAGNRNGAAVIFSHVASLRKDYSQYADCDIAGAVIAHELGHLLLDSAKHGDGIMKANWEPADLAAMRQRRLKFSQAEAREMGANLARRLVD